MFHNVCGKRITLSPDRKSAQRATSEFNNGLVFSSDPLKSNHLFEIRIEKKVYSWSGGLEIGVTKCDPDLLEVPSNASDLKHGTWMLSGNSILKDGRSVKDIYGINLNTIEEGDVLGVMKTDQNELIFYLNGQFKGIAAYNLPRRIFVVVDLYGQIIGASILSYEPVDNVRISFLSNELDSMDDSEITEGNTGLSNLVTNFDERILVPRTGNDLSPTDVPIASVDQIRFHSRCGTLAKISADGRTAERTRPLDEFNNGVVITHRPLMTNELYEIRIDKLIEKWSGSIEVGITVHNPDFLEFPPTMTNLKSGTIMMSGCGILTNGKATKRDYGDYNLDELMIGDRIGLLRKPSGDLHYFINGVDQGVAASNIPILFWGVVDLYGRTVMVTIVDRNEREENSDFTRGINIMRDCQLLQSLIEIQTVESTRGLLFHKKCGPHVAVINSNRTAYRPNALEDFNNGVVLTSRPLKVNEPFEVKLERVVSRWAGSIEIGVTSHSPSDLEFPSTMTNMRTGTWMMTGNGVMHNGTTVLDDYGVNLDRLQAGDRVGVMIKENGSLHLYVNGIDQGAVNAKITTPMYGVIDLYGQAAQATILEYDSLYSGISSLEWICPLPYAGPIDMCFHYNHGKNVRICNGGRTAYRTQPMAEFTNAIVICNRPLRNNELFAISIDKMIDVWSGSVEAGKCRLLRFGVTSIKVDEFELPSTMTDLDHDTWMLSGSNIMKDGTIIRLGYALNLDTVKINSVIGLMRHDDASVHYYLNGVDQGEACNYIPDVVYPVIDLYGQCSQVSIVSPPLSQVDDSSVETSHYHSTSNWADEIIRSLPSNHTLFEGPPRCFSRWCGKNIILSDDYVTATRAIEHNYGLVFSNFPLERDKIYEMSITKWNSKYAGCLSFGVSNIIPERCPLPPTISGLKPDVWFLRGDEVWCNGRVIKTHYGHNLHWLQNWSTIGVKHCSDNSIHFYINSVDQGVASNDISSELYIVVDLYGSAIEITMNREIRDMTASSLIPSVNIVDSIISVTSSTTQETSACIKDRLDDLKAERVIMEYNLQKNFEKEKSTKPSIDALTVKDWSFFQELRGRNIKLLNDHKTALRTESYNQGVVIVSKPLERDTLFQVKIDHLNSRWVSSLMIGVLCSPLTRSSLPVTAFGFKKDLWLIASDSVYHNGNKVKSRYGINLETLGVSQKVGILVDSNDDLKLFIDEIDQGIAASGIPSVCYIVLDIYGQCEQVTITDSEGFGDRLDPVDVLSPVLNASETEEHQSEPVSCEKADLERHEKESPSEEDDNFLKHDHPKSVNGDIDDHTKLNKTKENNAVLATSSNQNSEPEFHSKTDKTNENNSVMASSINSESHSKLSKTIENNAVIASSSNLVEELSKTKSANSTASCSTELTSSTSSSLSEDYEGCKNRKSLDNETDNKLAGSCDHKTSLDITNTMYIQAEKSTKSKNIKNCGSSSLSDRTVLLTKQNPNCEYRLRCYRFRNFLGLPVGFFASDTSILCYCSGCCLCITQQQKGDPPVAYSLPNGWCKFPLKKHLMTNNVDAVTLEKWHIAFMGISVGNIRRILDSGQLLAPDKLEIGFTCGEKSKLKDDESNKCQIVLSPTIKYAMNVGVASNYKYVDQKTKVTYICSAAFQVLVRPGSYKVGPPSSKISSKAMDPSFNTNTIEWVIKEKESTVLSALLFKIENS